jgi:hypothetical protein
MFRAVLQTFHDDRYRLSGLTLVGVIVSDRPLDANEERSGEDVFEVTMPDDLQHDEWAEGRRYLGMEILAKTRLTKINNDNRESEVTTTAALTA